MNTANGLASPKNAFIKRNFDILFSLIGLSLLWPLIFFAWLIASIDCRSNGFFIQTRVGQHGRLFRVIKIRTMKPHSSSSTVTTNNDPRVTGVGRLFRKSKIDELPQLINILSGSMSFVGPRPDVPGFADLLDGDDRLVLLLKPGITGMATLKYREEEILLASQSDPEAFNREVIWPDKVRLNLIYLHKWSLLLDLKIIFRTLFFGS